MDLPRVYMYNAFNMHPNQFMTYYKLVKHIFDPSLHHIPNNTDNHILVIFYNLLLHISYKFLYYHHQSQCKLLVNVSTKIQHVILLHAL